MSCRYIPYDQVGDHPHIIVDGAPLPSTVLNLSHWPVNRTPEHLRRDTSTETVFAWLDQSEGRWPVEIVSNNHFDEDGLFSVFAMCEPELALEHRELLIDASYAGDFGRFRSPEAARLCFVLEAYGCHLSSPFPAATFAGDAAENTAAMYLQTLGLLPVLLASLDAYESFWKEQDAHLTESLHWLDSGLVQVEELPEHDLAVVRIPDELPLRPVKRYFETELAAVHPFAIHKATDCTRLLRIQGRRLEFQYRYETWVRLASRRPVLRVRLDQLCAELNRLETGGDRWQLDKADDVIPRLHLDGKGLTGIDSDRVIDLLTEHLAHQPVAWDPYDWKPAAGRETQEQG